MFFANSCASSVRRSEIALKRSRLSGGRATPLSSKDSIRSFFSRFCAGVPGATRLTRSNSFSFWKTSVMKTDSSISARSAASRTDASGCTLFRSEIGPNASSSVVAASSQMSRTFATLTESSGSSSIFANRSRAAWSPDAAVAATSSEVRMGIVARTRKSGILAMFVFAVSVPVFAQQSLLDQGRAALQRNDAEAAKNLLEQAIAQTPNNVEAHYLLGQAYGTLISSASIFSKPGLATKTREQFEQAIQLDPNFIDARFGMIEWYLNAPGFMGGGEDKAVTEATEVKKRDAIDGHRAFAMIYAHQKKPDLVRKEYVDAVKEQPNSPRAHYYLGISNLQAKDNAGASAEFETAIKIEPQYMPGWFQIGHMAAITGTNMERGEDSLRKYLSYTPKRNEPPVYRAHFWLGTIYEKQGKKAEAKASFAKALSANPNQKDVQEALKRVS